MTKTGILGAMTAVALIGAVTEAHSAGFAIRETSNLTGQAFAGTAAAVGDVTTIFNNPASMAYLDKHQAAVSANLILPSTNFKDQGSSVGLPSNSGGNGGVTVVVPSLSGMWNIGHNFKFGLALTSPFGLSTKYKDGWKGRALAVKSRLTVFNINPSFSYKVSECLSLGFGVSLQHADAELSRYLGATGVAGSAKLTARASDWGAGFNFGGIFEPWKGTRFGLAYRSKILHGLDGTLNQSASTPGTGTAITKITADITTPDTIDFSATHDFNDKLTVLGTVMFTRWNVFNKLDIVRAQATTAGQAGGAGAQGSFVSSEREAWRNTWFFALGLNYKFYQGWMLRLGAAFDQTPVRTAFRTPKLPDSSRTWVSAGLDYNFTEGLSARLSYAHLFMSSAKVNVLGATAPGVGNLIGKFNNKVDIIGVQVNYKF
jgi:long-chain fatty acid transport protein